MLVATNVKVTAIQVLNGESFMTTTSIRLDTDLVDKVTIMAKALNRKAPKQIEHWVRIGEMMEDNPDLLY
jgi:hypothetical protein